MKDKKDLKPDKRKKILVGAIIILSFVIGFIMGHQDALLSRIGYTPEVYRERLSNSDADFSIFWRAWDLIVENYDGEVDYQAMIYGAIKGMTESLGDPYTAFLTPEEAKQLEDDLSGVFYGIGAEIGIKNDELTVITPLNGTPAKEAGLMAGDVILAIDGESTLGMNIDIAVAKIRGDEGTEVTLSIRRDEEVKDYKIKRAKITVKSVDYEIRDGNIGYIEISRFDENTTDLLRKGLDELNSKEVKKIVLDLRGNPGGYLDESITVASEFLKEGVIVTEKNDKNGDKEYEYKATGNGKMTGDDIKIIVLINEGSASASEIVAGALKDQDRATLVGETTFGKGSVQEIENLARGSVMRLTIAHWYTPSGMNIAEEGIEPDVRVELTEDDYNADRDPQLAKAFELLK
ncbi:MAG: S41 family peptidase [Patescibacteria group bacterium]|nr:S41 family peptidase [Patescibacteria group bacterium]